MYLAWSNDSRIVARPRMYGITSSDSFSASASEANISAPLPKRGGGDRASSFSLDADIRGFISTPADALLTISAPTSLPYEARAISLPLVLTLALDLMLFIKLLS